ncbi:phage capsid protein [Acinetobacter sp. ANC 7201]|uniref:phage capsid protein n=1 Tax=Acinetobacter sp. ANC 7201 TaxID=3035288 RepID=UPI0027A0C633|nr:phage capsid protein [Acinetobacter sp. ANC 7201]WFP97982.1 phage capsid protein [Acinetobacter sp. ANC 7201]
MANENKITAAFVQQFHDNYELASQQNESRLLKTVVNRGKIVGESFTINDMGQVEMAASGARFGDTAWTIPDAGTRSVLMNDFDLFIPIESRDIPKLKAHPNDKYIKLLYNAKNRKIDDIVYQAAIGTINRKSVADNGTATTTPTALPADQIILSGFGTLKQKIIKAKSIFRKNEADEHNGEQLYILYTSDMLSSILGDTTLTSADFMAGKMLQDGGVGGKWMGFNWIPYEKLSQGAAEGELRTVAYCGSAIHFGEADITGFDITTRSDKKNIKQVGGVHSLAAGRANEKKVVAIDFVV